MLKHFTTAAFLIAGLTVGCSDSEDAPAPITDNTSSNESPAHLVEEDGSYSDERFIDMIVPHHMMAMEHSQLALERATRPELREMASKMIEDQQKEISELKAIKQRDFGTAETPAEMHPEQMRNSGTMTTQELAAASEFDRAFIDSMLPHHAGALQLASVVLRRSQHSELRAMARMMIDMQGKEIGQLQAWREGWFGTAP